MTRSPKRFTIRRPADPGRRAGKHRRARGALASTTATLMVATLAPALLGGSAPVSAAPVGQGFTLARSDLDFILKQIKIAERHEDTRSDANPCGTLLGTGVDQIPNDGPNGEVLPWGLRTVDGTCNNLLPGQETFGAAGQTFPRLADARFRAAEGGDVDGAGPTPPVASSSYATEGGNVFDSRPRTISNLIADQTQSNPAAVEAAGFLPSDVGCGAPSPTCNPTPGPGRTLPIGNVATDVGLSAPFNAMFTFFGQFFDHGLDLVTKGGGTVFMPLKADDPLVNGADGLPGGGDDLPASRRFMVLTRTQNAPGTRDGTNLTTSFVDQNQTYSSHPSHQLFLREYDAGAVATGRLIETDDGMATWSTLRAQASTVLGIALSDADALDVPLLATDPYGQFVPGPARGLPQLVTATGMVEGNTAAPVSLPADTLRTGHPFLADIAHHAQPVGDPTGPADGPATADLSPDPDTGLGDDNQAATYDDEMLGSHFIAGDGRVNENIALTAVHHIFHSEHNRLAADIDALVTAQGAAYAATWNDDPAASAWAYGDRLFQAARFVTEMEYQHLAFEEFARKVQPAVNAFGEGGTGYQTVTDAAIKAEFAHAVYRFGHSMLTETVDRRNVNGAPVNNDVGLVEAFLNPQEFRDDGAGGRLTPDQAAGSIFRGMTRVPGMEIDEFTTEALRNNLLGLPLDLAAINLGRARDAGVPSLNELRTIFYAESNNSQVQPYTSWADFGYNLKHRLSLVNFVAAYGQHPSITGVETLAGKRAAAQALVDPDPIANPAAAAEASDFMNATGPWATEETGLDLVDLWMGGLAEKQMVFGGLLGSTFNYVFEKQMEDLQFADRFYYLARTQGQNLLVQLEGNSFAELVMRNTDVEGLPADIFSRPDLVLNLQHMGPVGGPVVDDPTTEGIDESTQANLAWTPGPTIRFSGGEHVVFNGRDGAADRIWSSEGDDTIRGNGGNDWVQGGDGNDHFIGGDGDDIMQDLNGDDVMKGGPGHDAISSGQGGGGDLNQGGTGQDFVIGGNDVTETFAGAGDDFVFAGDDLDTVFGDEGDDWLEGGFGPFNLVQGDAGQAFQDDPDGGHDVLDGEGGEQDFDAEGGDDIMLMGPGIQRAEGMLGWDWATHKGDPSPANSDMAFSGLLPPSVNDLRDRFDLVEGLSGAQLNDRLRGDDRVATDFETGTNGTHTLQNAAAIARIQGLAALLPSGATSFGAGNIILGGAGNDLIEGRGGDDVIDGDAWLNVVLRAPDVATPAPGDVREVDSVKQLQGQVFAGLLNPSQISIVRRIEVPAGSGDDTALFSGSADEYEVTGSCAEECTVEHLDGGVDGTDTLRNIEVVQFGGTPLPGATVPAAPGAPTAVGADGSATVTFAGPSGNGGSPVTQLQVQVRTGAAVVATITNINPADGSRVVTGLDNGTAYTFTVIAVNAVGDSAPSPASNEVTPQGPPPAPEPEPEPEPVPEPGPGPVPGSQPGAGPGTVPATGTAPAPDLRAPQVVRGGLTVPAPGARNVARGAALVTELSETVLGVGNGAVTLRNLTTGARVRTVVTARVNAAGVTVVEVRARKRLARDTRYRLILTSAIHDAAGNPLQVSRRTFRTGR